MNKKEIAVLIGLAALIGIVIACTLLAFWTITPHSVQESVLGGGVPGGPTGDGGGTRFTNLPSNTSVVCGQTPVSTLVEPTSTSRTYLTMVNDSSANQIYISEGQAAVASNGLRLNSGGGSYEMNALNMTIDAVYCTAAASSTLTIIANQQ